MTEHARVTVEYWDYNAKVRTVPLTDNQKAKLPADGYGKKVPVNKRVTIDGREYQVYYTCFSNCASFWIKVRGKQLFCPYHTWLEES